MSEATVFYLNHNVRSNHKARVYAKLCFDCGHRWESKGPNAKCPRCGYHPGRALMETDGRFAHKGPPDTSDVDAHKKYVSIDGVKYYGKRSTVEVASMLGVSREYVRQVLVKAIPKLQAKLRKSYEGL